MKLWPWGLLLIGLIGTAAAATVIVTLQTPGVITIVQPGLTWVSAPNLANIQLPLGGTFSIPFTVKNSGGLDLTLSCSSDIAASTGISVSCTGFPSGTLAAGAQVSANIVFTASTTASATNLGFTFTLSGST